MSNLKDAEQELKETMDKVREHLDELSRIFKQILRLQLSSQALLCKAVKENMTTLSLYLVKDDFHTQLSTAEYELGKTAALLIRQEGNSLYLEKSPAAADYLSSILPKPSSSN